MLERWGYMGYMAMRQWDSGHEWRLHMLFDVEEVAPKVVMPRAPWHRHYAILFSLSCWKSYPLSSAASPVPLESGVHPPTVRTCKNLSVVEKGTS